MKRTLDILRRLFIALLCLLLVSGLSLAAALNYKALLARRRLPAVDSYAAAVEELIVPPQSKVVALGEATHGNREFQELKLEVLQNLVRNNGCRALAMELDFGEALAFDAYIQGGAGEARALAASLSYPIYHTQQIAELIDWMRGYNQTAPEEERLRFYGFDMQNTIPGAQYLLEFCRTNALPGVAEALQTIRPLAGMEADLNPNSAASMAEALEVLTEALRRQDAADAEIAVQAAATLTQAMGSYAIEGEDYANYRNACMADNAAWIIEREAERGGAVLLAAHNAHIARTWPDGSTPMGQLLAGRLGAGYYAIGTDFFTADVNIKTSAMMSEGYERSNHRFCSADVLAYQARYQAGGRYFLNFREIASGTPLYETVHTAQTMGNIGEGYLWLWYLFPESSYRTEAVPADLYDGMIYLSQAAPTEVWE